MISVSLDETNLSMKVGEEKTLTATVLPENATDKRVAWSSSAPSIASVNNGVIFARAAGSAIITVTTNDGGKKANCSVTVSPPPITGIEDVETPLATVYPNPTDNAVTVEFEAEGVYIVTLADMTGKVLLRQTVNEQTVSMDLSNYPTGAYLLTIDDGKRQSTTRVIKN